MHVDESGHLTITIHSPGLVSLASKKYNKRTLHHMIIMYSSHVCMCVACIYPKSRIT